MCMCACLYDTCKSAYTYWQGREGLVAMAEEIIINKLINVKITNSHVVQTKK